MHVMVDPFKELVAVDFGEPVLGAAAYRRAGDRPAPYNFMFDPAAAFATVQDPSASEASWLSFGDYPTEEAARTVEIGSSRVHEVANRNGGISTTEGWASRSGRSKTLTRRVGRS